MKRKFPSFDFLIVVLTLGASAYVIYTRAKYHFVQAQLKEKFIATRNDFSARKAAADIPSETLAQSPTRLAPRPSEVKSTRNILFTIKTRAKKVSLVGDFNDWIPEEMTKDARGVWSIAVKLSPGEYAYNYIVDGRPLRDFNNPKTKDTGRGFVSSLLVVKPLE